MSKVLCLSCGTPIAEVQHDALLIRSKHHGEEHVNVLTLTQLTLILQVPQKDLPGKTDE